MSNKIYISNKLARIKDAEKENEEDKLKLEGQVQNAIINLSSHVEHLGEVLDTLDLSLQPVMSPHNIISPDYDVETITDSISCEITTQIDQISNFIKLRSEQIENILKMLCV